MAGGAVPTNQPVFEQEHLASPLKSWTVVLVAALFFLYEFIQMNMLNAISIPLLKTFHIDATTLGAISSYYFISTVIFLFIAGILLDRISPKKIIITALIICILGTIWFGASTSVWMTMVARFFTGIGSAFCFLSCIRIASRWFPPRHMALVIGWIVTMAMIGGTVAQTPLTLLVGAVGWREALFYDAGLGVIILFFIIAFVKDLPPLVRAEEQHEHEELKALGYWKSMRLAFLRIRTWLGGIYTSLLNLPLILLGGLWGTLYLEKVHHIGRVHASVVTSMLFIGTIVGSPLIGWLSDKLRLRKSPMLIGAVISLVLTILLVHFPTMSYGMMTTLFLLIGFVTAAQIIGYPYVAEISPRMITAMSVSVVNISTQAFIAIFQPLFGYFMDLHAGIAHPLKHGYVSGDFSWAMLIFPIGMVLAILCAFCFRETHGKSLEQRQAEQGK